ncbi:MAG TPA: hypothetical protein VGO67_06650 [Verrucomicrobiae bacterium]
MRPRDYEDGKRRLNFPRCDQRSFWLLPQTAGVPHPTRLCPFQSPNRALVAASLWLPSGFASRRSATDSTPDALFHRSAPLSAPQIQTEAQIFGPFGAQQSIRTTTRQQVCERSASTCNSCPVITQLGNSG